MMARCEKWHVKELLGGCIYARNRTSGDLLAISGSAAQLFMRPPLLGALMMNPALSRASAQCVTGSQERCHAHGPGQPFIGRCAVMNHAGLTKDGFTGMSSKACIILTMLQYQDDSIGVKRPHSLLPGYQHAAPLNGSNLMCPIPRQHTGSPLAPANLIIVCPCQTMG